MGDIVLDKDRFFKRLREIHQHWDDDPTLANVDCVYSSPGNSEDSTYSKATALQIYLFGIEIGETLSILGRNFAVFLSNKRKIQFLKCIENGKENSNIQLIERDKTDKDASNFQKVIQILKDSEVKRVGFFGKDKMKADFIKSWKSVLDNEEFEAVDVSVAFGVILAQKGEDEIATMQKACDLTCKVFQQYVRKQIIDIVDDEKKVRHEKLAQNVDGTLANSNVIGSLDPASLEMCYTPIFQSGGNYSLKFSALSDKNYIKYDNIICSFGVRYQYYCCNIVRTVMVDPSEDYQNSYELLLECEDELLANLVPGKKLCDVYNAVIEFLREKRPEFVDKLTPNFGFGTGIEFRESSLLIGPKTQETVRANMTFCTAVGFSNIKSSGDKEDEGPTTAFFLGDTVIVKTEGPAMSLTEAAKKKLKSVSLFFKNDADEGSGADNKESVLSSALANHTNERGKRSTVVIQDKMRNKMTSEDNRKKNQKDLAVKLNQEALERIAQAKEKDSGPKVRKSNISYKDLKSMPQDSNLRELKIYVDKKYETLILPIYGMPVPFHISVIKNISHSVEGDFTYLRINFFHPTSSYSAKESFHKPDATFLKELTYRSSNARVPGETAPSSANLNTAARLIKEIQKKFKTREAEEKEKEGIVKQDKLVLSQTKSINPRLKDVYVRPNLTGSTSKKRLTGSLEAHVNGFRFTAVNGDKVDILYNNIKHGFFQPCDHEMIVLLHFNLKNAILFGKKRVGDIQFYTEVGETHTDLSRQIHTQDRDDLYAEQQERDLRNKLNGAFKSFCDKVERLTNQEVEFDTPFRELGFQGVPSRVCALLQPTSSCLVNLTEWPSFVVTLDELELVHFERVSFQLKNFDMVFIFKDYNRKPITIQTVPMTMLDHVKEWLNSCDIRYTEGIQSLNWAKIMKTILDDPQHFFEEGGWNFLNAESDDEGGKADEDSDEDDEAYQPSDAEGSNASGEDGSMGSSEDEYESEASESEESERATSGSESGKDWSDLEEEAAKADRVKDDGGDVSAIKNNPKRRMDSKGGPSAKRRK